MNNPELTLAERHHWTQVHTYTAQVYNTILRDQQLKEWEKRLKELEQRGLTYKTLPVQSTPAKQTTGTGGVGATSTRHRVGLLQ